MSVQEQIGFADWLTGLGAVAPGASADWLTAERTAARQRVAAAPMPNRRQETWRYTSVKGLLEHGFQSGRETARPVQSGDLERALVAGLDTHRVVLVNGAFRPELSDLTALPAGVRVRGLKELLGTEPGALKGILTAVCGAGAHVFADLNTAALDDGVVLMLDASVVVDRPIELIHLSVGADEARVVQPRVVISLGAGADAEVIERYLSLDPSLYCTNTVLEIALAAGAALRHQRIQLESPAAFHLSGVYLQQAAGSRYKGLNLGLGARWARTDIRARFLGEGAHCDLQGLYLCGDQQLIDYHLDVDHAVPGCTSVERFKGILTGSGRAVFDGRVFVAKDAQKTDAQMSNHNLLLSRKAEVDTKPQLEIHADDVKCSHGTTVGQIDPDALFYLRARGIPAAQARRMICLGFAGEVLDGITQVPLRESLTEWVGDRLESAAEE